jgi:hypothetical protein
MRPSVPWLFAAFRCWESSTTLPHGPMVAGGRCIRQLARLTSRSMPPSSSDISRRWGSTAGKFGTNPICRFGADPARYTQLLKAAYVAIKATDAGATVVTGGLAPAASSGGDLTPTDFLTGIYNNGGQGYFDAVADHPYTYPSMPDDRSGGAYWWQAMNDLHAIMTVHGDSSKLIWMTEYGAPTNGPPAARFVSESNQAVMLTKSYTMIETYEWAGPLFWYALHDGGPARQHSRIFSGSCGSMGRTSQPIRPYNG